MLRYGLHNSSPTGWLEKIPVPRGSCREHLSSGTTGSSFQSCCDGRGARDQSLVGFLLQGLGKCFGWEDVHCASMRTQFLAPMWMPVIPALTKERDRRIPGACWLASKVQIWWATLSQKHKINLPGEHLGLTSGLQMYMYMNAPIHHGWVQMFVGTHRDTYTRGLTVNEKSEYWFCRGIIISRKVCVTVNTKCPCWASAISAKCCWYWSPEKWWQASRDVSSVTTAALCSLGSSWAFAIYGGVFSAVLCSCLPVFQCRLLSLLGGPCDINLSFLYFLLF